MVERAGIGRFKSQHERDYEAVGDRISQCLFSRISANLLTKSSKARHLSVHNTCGHYHLGSGGKFYHLRNECLSYFRSTGYKTQVPFTEETPVPSAAWISQHREMIMNCYTYYHRPSYQRQSICRICVYHDVLHSFV